MHFVTNSYHTQMNFLRYREKIVKSNLMPKLADACRHRHYVAHYFFLETVLKSLPLIGHNLGKRPIKMYLEEFLDHIFYAAECENALASTAALKCLRDLSDLLGPNIMRGRVIIHLYTQYITLVAELLPVSGGFLGGSGPESSYILIHNIYNYRLIG